MQSKVQLLPHLNKTRNFPKSLETDIKIGMCYWFDGKRNRKKTIRVKFKWIFKNNLTH